jgi:hypothetical protein
VTASRTDNPPDDCDAPERHTDGGACVRPGDEPTTWDTLTLGGVRFPAAGDEVTVCRHLGEQLRQMSEAVLPIGATLRILSPVDVAPEHCPLCIEALRLDRRLRGDRCPVHDAGRAFEVYQEAVRDAEESDDELRARLKVRIGGER